MEIVRPKREKTVSLPAGDALVVAASTGALARVWRIDNTPVTNSVVQGGTSVNIGPNENVTRYNIESISGEVAFEIKSTPANKDADTMTDTPTALATPAQSAPATPGAVTAPAMKLPNFGSIATVLGKLNASLEKRAQRIAARAELTEAKGAAVEARVVAHLEATEAAIAEQIAHLDQVDATIGDNGAPGGPLST